MHIPYSKQYRRSSYFPRRNGKLDDKGRGEADFRILAVLAICKARIWPESVPSLQSLAFAWSSPPAAANANIFTWVLCFSYREMQIGQTRCKFS